MINPLHPFPFPSQHANAYGQDQYGYWQSIVLCGVSTRFRWIAPGSFKMGSPADEPERDDDEIQHQVTLTRGYWLAETACSQALWLAVTGSEPSFFEGADLPVEQVSWQDVQELFLEKLAPALIDMQPCLPSEAQWEYACRAGSDTAFSFGDELNASLANYDGNYPYNDAPEGEYRKATVAVQSFEPNDWGLYQMHGNVLEWCEDGFGEYVAEPVSDPKGQPEASGRVLRGGSWYYRGRNLRSAYRIRSESGFRDNLVGFRLAQVPCEP